MMKFDSISKHFLRVSLTQLTLMRKFFADFNEQMLIQNFYLFLPFVLLLLLILANFHTHPWRRESSIECQEQRKVENKAELANKQATM